MRVALGQIDCVAGDAAANVATMLAFARRAHAAGCGVIVFPEMSDTGYLPARIPAAAGSGGEVLRALSGAASELRIWILAGLSEKAEDRLYNSIAVFRPDGSLCARYRKIHLFRPPPIREDGIFSCGNALAQCAVGQGRWGLSICYDLRFPEIYRRYALAGAELLLNCAAWPAARIAHWATLARARAVENQCFFLGVNRVGRDGEVAFGGRSVIVSPTGDVLAEGSDHAEELVVGDMTLAEIGRARSAIPAFEDRLPGGYDALPLDCCSQGAT